jgi:hypothetical protein
LIPTYLVSEDAPDSDVQLMHALRRLREQPSNASHSWTFCVAGLTGNVYRMILAREPELRPLRQLLHALGYVLAGSKEERQEVYKLR